MIPVEAQFQALVAMVILGVVMGIAFDIYRELRNTFRLKPMATNVWDLLVWLIFVILAYAVLLYTNYGEVRLYVFMGMALGLLIYFRIFSKTARKPIQIMLFALLKIISIVWIVVKIPFVFLQKVLVVPANLISLVLFKLFDPVRRVYRKLRFKPKE